MDRSMVKKWVDPFLQNNDNGKKLEWKSPNSRNLGKLFRRCTRQVFNYSDAQTLIKTSNGKIQIREKQSTACMLCE